MDSTLPVFYIGIIAWESVTMLLCWWPGVRLLKSYRADRAQFAAALNVAVIALTKSNCLPYCLLMFEKEIILK
jgi:predicted small integral membrane protein